MLLHQVGQIGEVTASSTGIDFPPFALECFTGGGDSDIDILLGGLMDGDNGLLVGGVDGLECLAVDTFHPFVVDEAVPRLLASCSGLVGSILRAGFAHPSVKHMRFLQEETGKLTVLWADHICP